MARKAGKAILATLCSVLLVSLPAAKAGTPAAMGKLDPNGPTEVNGTVAPRGTTIFPGDRIVTSKDTSASLALTGGSHLILAEASSLRAEDKAGQPTVGLDRGSLVVLNSASAPVVVEAAGARIYAAKGDAAYVVAVEGNGLEVFARKGEVEAEAADRTVEVGAGKTLEATLAPLQGPIGVVRSAKWKTVAVIIVLTAAAAGTALGIAIKKLEETCRATPSPFSVECN